jgi:disulfide bond formation protein DsbB
MSLWSSSSRLRTLLVLLFLIYSCLMGVVHCGVATGPSETRPKASTASRMLTFRSPTLSPTHPALFPPPSTASQQPVNPPPRRSTTARVQHAETVSTLVTVFVLLGLGSCFLCFYSICQSSASNASGIVVMLNDKQDIEAQVVEINEREKVKATAPTTGRMMTAKYVVAVAADDVLPYSLSPLQSPKTVHEPLPQSQSQQQSQSKSQPYRGDEDIPTASLLYENDRDVTSPSASSSSGGDLFAPRTAVMAKSSSTIQYGSASSNSPVE